MQLLPALKYLQNFNVMHRDLNLMKILVKREEENNQIIAKLSGFECASNVKLEAT